MSRAARLSGYVRETDGALVVRASRVEIIKKAYELYGEGYTTVVSLTAIDYPAEGELEVVVAVTGYELGRDKPRIAEIRARIPRDDPWIPSLTQVWPSAELQERETYEMFGITFKGHPDLRHLLLSPDDYKEVYPLRKDYPVKEEPIFADIKKWGKMEE